MRVLVSLVVSAGFCACASAADADDYAFAWPIATSGDSAAWQIELTPEVYAAVTTADLRDLAVVDADGNAVPTSQRAVETATVAEDEIELPQFALPSTPAKQNSGEQSVRIENSPDGKLRIVDVQTGAPLVDTAASVDKNVRDLLLDATQRQRVIESLWLTWDQTGDSVSATFNVSESNDLQEWRTLIPNATVLNLRQDGNTLSRREIVLNARISYLRLRRIDSSGPLPNLRIRARYAHSAELIRASRVWITAHPTQPSNVSGIPVFNYRLPAPLPVEAARLELITDNSLARVRLASRSRPGDDPAAWSTRGDFIAFRLHQNDGVINNDEIAVDASTRAQDWRVEPATPLNRIPTLSVAFRPDRFMFLAQGNGSYRLVAGSAKARRGDYPVDTALATLRARSGSDWQPPLATLESRITLAGDRALVVENHDADGRWKTWLLWAVLIGAAVVIIGIALKLMRETGDNSPQ